MKNLKLFLSAFVITICGMFIFLGGVKAAEIQNVRILSDEKSIAWDAYPGTDYYRYGIVEKNTYSEHITETTGDPIHYLQLNDSSLGYYTFRVTAYASDTPVASTDMLIYYGGSYIEKAYKITYDFNGGTRNGNATEDVNMVSFVLMLSEEVLMEDVTPPSGQVLDAILVNGERKEFGSGLEINKDYTIKYLWKDAGTEMEVSDASTLLTYISGNNAVSKFILTNDITVNEELDVVVNGYNRVIDLNGYTLHVDNEFIPKYYTINSITITDTSTNKTGKFICPNTILPINYNLGEEYVSFIVNGGTFEINHDTVFENRNYFKLVINDGTFKSKKSLYEFKNDYASNITLNNLTFEALNKETTENIYLCQKCGYENEYPTDVMGSNKKLLYVDENNNYSINNSEPINKAYPGSGKLLVSEEYSKVTFNTDGGSSISDQIVKNGNKITKQTPTKEGYAFGGWYKDSEKKNIFNPDKDTITTDTTLYAKWKIIIKGEDITLDKKTFIYTGKEIKPKVTIKYGSKVLEVGKDYTIKYKENINVGTASITFDSKDYSIGVTKFFTISKANNPMTVTYANKKVKYKKVKKKAQSVSAITVKNTQGTVSYQKLSGKKKITINTRTGKITVKKKTKKGTYKIKVKVSTNGNRNYKAASKIITVTIKVK